MSGIAPLNDEELDDTGDQKVVGGEQALSKFD